MENLTTQDEPISLRDTIESAIIEETPLASTETALEAPKSDRVRDDSGKFAKTSTVDDNDFGFEPESAPVETKPRPSSWKKDYEDIKTNRKFFGDFDPFGDFDLLFGAAKLNLKIIDLPIHYQERTYGTTNISRWKHGWLLLKMTVFAARKIKFI